VDHAHALEHSLLVSSVASGGKMHALCGRQDARRYDSFGMHWKQSNGVKGLFGS